MTYHCDTLSDGRHFLTAKQDGRVVASTVVTGTLTERSIRRLKSSTKPYRRKLQLFLSLFQA